MLALLLGIRCSSQKFMPMKHCGYLIKNFQYLNRPSYHFVMSITNLSPRLIKQSHILMIILSNLPPQKATIMDLAVTYLKHWPNLAESFRDFNRKVEFFTYVGSSRPDIKLESVGLNQDSADIKQVLSAYLQILDIYVKRNFLPVNYDSMDFSQIKERFYHLKAVLKKETGFISITFQAPSDYPYLHDLEYACCRLNEREIKFSGDTPVWFRVA